MAKICKAVLKKFLKAILSNMCPARDNYENDIKKTDLIKINFYWTMFSSMWCFQWCCFCLTGQSDRSDDKKGSDDHQELSCSCGFFCSRSFQCWCSSAWTRVFVMVLMKICFYTFYDDTGAVWLWRLYRVLLVLLLSLILMLMLMQTAWDKGGQEKVEWWLLFRDRSGLILTGEESLLLFALSRISISKNSNTQSPPSQYHRL